jgi:hypothetical protein
MTSKKRRVMTDSVEGASTGASGVLVVMAHAPASVSEEEFLAWFRSHLPEILAIPCFVEARLLEIEVFASAPGQALPYKHMAIYDFVGDPASAMGALAEARAAGQMKLPEWFDEFERDHCLVSWTGVPA